MRYLGIDYGSRKVGLALSDEAGTMGFPHGIVPNNGRLIDELAELIERKKVEAVIFGESKDFNGVENAIMKNMKEFALALERRTHMPVYFEPEMLTTQEARRSPEGERTSLSFYTEVDASAAALILTSYLSRTHS